MIPEEPRKGVLTGTRTQVVPYIPRPPVDPIGETEPPVVFLRDPNDKIGPTGVGPDRLVSTQDSMDYMIRFENFATATAPVQELVVVDYLDPNLDWSTVGFGEIRYGDRVITVPAGQLSFSTRDLPPTNSIAITGITLGRLAVDRTATFNSQNGRLEWRLLAKDTANNQFPYDALAGFLPPNNTNTHCGEGHLNVPGQAEARPANRHPHREQGKYRLRPERPDRNPAGHEHHRPGRAKTGRELRVSRQLPAPGDAVHPVPYRVE